jgi:transcriptional regulator GlxA family with amidase domain
MTEPRRIAALAYPGLQLLDIVGPLETFNLAAQQLIDDRERNDRAKRRFPDVLVEADRIFLEDSGIFTSGGITAGIDLALPIIRIANECGFCSADAMRYAFAKQLDVTPGEYRQRFGSTAAKAS